MASFQRVALGLLLAVVALGCLAGLFPPACALQSRSVAQPPPVVQQEPPPAVAPADPRSVDLDAIAAGAAVPRLTAWPPFGGLDSGSETTPEKAFVARLLPLVLTVDEEALARRARLWSIRQEVSGGGKLPPEDRLWLSDAFGRYQVEPADMAALTRRIDAVPPSILIAAAAIATGWNVADEAGWRAMAAAAQVTATPPTATSASPPAAPPLEALRLYLWTINTHPDFAPFRRARERARLASIPLAGVPLAVTLPRVAPGRLPGATALVAVIAEYQLERFDAARLAGSGPQAARGGRAPAAAGRTQGGGFSQEIRYEQDYARMNRTMHDTALDAMFREARTHTAWQDRPVGEEVLRAAWDLARMGPTSANSQPARIVFVVSAEAKEKLRPALIPTNVDKTMSAPATAIIAYDLAFYDLLPELYPQADARSWFVGNEALIASTAFRNGSLQGGYFILAARALGLDCGPMSGFDNAAVDAAFFAGTQVRSNFLCNLGYGEPSKLRVRNKRLSFDEACRIA